MKVEFDFKRAEKLILEHKVNEMSTSEYTHWKTDSNKFEGYHVVKKRPAIEKYSWIDNR